MYPSPLASAPSTAFGVYLRDARLLRRLSQLDLAVQAQVSTRHLSFVETGRATPSRDMVLRLAQCLQVPLRERNGWLVAAGFAPMYRERAFEDSELSDARRAVELLLAAQEPFPAIAMDRHWNVVAANRATPIVMGSVDPSLLQPRPNVLRMTHHPDGLAPRIANLAQLRAHHEQRLQQQIRASGDAVLAQMLVELRAYAPPSPAQAGRMAGEHLGVVAPLQIRSDAGVLSFFTASTVFGSVADITLSEMAMELFLPADAFTAEAVPRLVRAALG